MVNLDDIAVRLGTDKSSRGHNYTGYYQKNFKDFVHKEISLLEIGILQGQSLMMWKEFFPKGKIYGLDITDCSHMNQDRLLTIKGDQRDRDLLLRMSKDYGPFDIIIDDGSHMSSAMRDSFTFLFPYIKRGGYYVVEDLHACYLRKKYVDELPSFMSYVKELLDYINCYGKFMNAAHIDTKNLNFYEYAIESITMYRSICFIKRSTL